ncbi:MAG: alpha/beta fold hydrolase [Bacteroidales bacterium]|nr:alpha/beta fold hydrolase [Bacteroidales bacterium]
MKAFIFTLIIFVSASLFAQNLKGTWNGDLDLNGISLAIVVNINGFSADSITMDSPEQSAFGIKVDNAEFNEDGFKLEIVSLKASLIGENPVGDSIKCEFTQYGTSFPLTLKRGNYVPKPKKQDPKDFPYIVEEVEIFNPETNVKLAGTLTVPYDYKCDKIVILVSGSGLQNRNEEILGHKPFLVLSDYLTRNGIAVIRYDDRGFAKSTGDATNATTYDLSLDAESVVKYIKNDSRLKNMKVGIIGHSEGGMIAPMVAARNSDVDFVVMLAGPAVNIWQLMARQNYDVLSSNGISEDIAKQYAQLASKTYKILNDKKSSIDDKKAKIRANMNEMEKLAPSGYDEETLQANLDMLFSPWMSYFIDFNPQDYLCKVKVPLLALNGDKDVQVYSKDNLAGVEKAMKKAKNKNYKTIELKGLNHLFQKCIFGSPNFYGRNEETFNEDAMKTIAEWIQGI